MDRKTEKLGVTPSLNYRITLSLMHTIRPIIVSLLLMGVHLFADSYDHEMMPADTSLPTLWLIGDSTVKVSTVNQWGWGEKLGDYIDTSKYNVVNRAIGGRSSRTFISQGWWDKVLELMRPGDCVFIQFGHNDSSPVNDKSRARGTIKGIGEEIEEIENLLTGQPETVHTYGWYLRKYVADTRSKGGTPILCSPVPRKIWENGEIVRNMGGYAAAAKQVARNQKALFIDLSEIIARGYEALGAEIVDGYFADARVHQSAAGALFNAEAVIAGIKGLAFNPLAKGLGKRSEHVQSYPPKQWIDPKTGYRVERLSDEPGTASLYFHQNAYSTEGDQLIVTTPIGIATINLQTGQNRLIVDDPRARVLVVGKRSRSVYFSKRNDDATTVFRAHLDTGAITEVASIPSGTSIASLNADESLLLGSVTHRRPVPLNSETPDAARDGSRPQGEWMRETQMENPQTGEPLTFAEQKEWRLNSRLEQRLPMEIVTIDTKSGRINTVHKATDWLNHLQFSPADPKQIMFCHEGPWHRVDRIWTINTDGSNLRKVHARTINMEIAGHEFFSQDGKTIWYDLQRPRGEVFWLAGYNLETEHRDWFALDRDDWSVHFNISPDGSLFAGDGGDYEMVAHAPDGKWIYLFEPVSIPDVAGISAPDSESLIHPGRLKSTRLVDMSHHDYRLEPNVTFTPDSKRIIFRSNMHGSTHTYAVTIK